MQIQNFIKLPCGKRSLIGVLTIDNIIATLELDVAKSKLGIFQCAFLDKEVMQELILIQISKIYKINQKTLKTCTKKTNKTNIYIFG